MPWMPGLPHDPAEPKGYLDPVAIVLHRTYGQWGGDYGVIKNNSLCQFLIGKEPGQWCEFMDTNSVAYHCNGANFKAVGIELTGVNEDPLTPWQEARLGDVLRFLNVAHGIPLDYLDPDTVAPASVWVNGGGFRGVISHDSVATDDGSSQHSDLVTQRDFILALLPSFPPKPKPEPIRTEADPMLFVFDPSHPADIWCVSGNTKRHVVPDEWAFRSGPYGGNPFTAVPGGAFKAITVSQAWFESYPVAA